MYTAGRPKWFTLDLVDMPIIGLARIDCIAEDEAAIDNLV